MISYSLSYNQIALIYDALEAYKITDDKDTHCQCSPFIKLDMMHDIFTSFELTLYPEEYA